MNKPEGRANDEKGGHFGGRSPAGSTKPQKRVRSPKRSTSGTSVCVSIHPQAVIATVKFIRGATLLRKKYKKIGIMSNTHILAKIQKISNKN